MPTTERSTPEVFERLVRNAAWPNRDTPDSSEAWRNQVVANAIGPSRTY